MTALTPKQAATLTFIGDYHGVHGYPPTVREMCSEFAITTQAVVDRLKMLERKGFIERQAHRSRAITLVRPKTTP